MPPRHLGRVQFRVRVTLTVTLANGCLVFPPRWKCQEREEVDKTETFWKWGQDGNWFLNITGLSGSRDEQEAAPVECKSGRTG